MTEKIRAFICIDLPDEIIKEVARLQQLIKKQKFIGKITELENLHLTLKFLGEITLETLAKVQSALEKISFPKCNAVLAQTGAFSYRKQPRIVWIKIASKEIHELQKKIDAALENLFPSEERFMSHLTIARIKYTTTPEEFTTYIKKLPLKKIKFPITEFKLKSSTLTPQGSMYTTLQTIPLR